MGSLAAVAAPLAAAEARLVAPPEKSVHFDAVNRHLELGGTVYGYMDVDGDVLRIVEGLRGIIDSIVEENPESAMLRQDFGAIAGDLGLTDIKAIGLSSVAVPGRGFRNRVFLHTPDGRRGLLAGLGGPVAPFSQVHLAPADTDLYFETELDLPAVYAALRATAGRVGGDMLVQMVESQLKAAGNEAGISAYDLLQSLKGRVAGVVRLDNEQTFVIPGREPLVVPAFSLLLRIDGIAPGLQAMLEQLPMLQRTEQDGRVLYTFAGALPYVEWQPVIAVEGKALYIVSSPAFFATCLSTADRLAKFPVFSKALAELGGEGNELGYVSPGLFAKLRRIPELNPETTPEQKRILNLALANLPETDAPILSIRVNLPDGVLYRSLRDSSLKQEIVMAGIYNPVTIGMMAAMAIPAFQKVRTNSQQSMINNNLRQLAAAAEQFYLENGVETTTYDQLVGPDKYIREMKSVAGEDYRSIRFKLGDPLVVRTADGREFEFSF